MSTFGGGYKINRGATGGDVCASNECAFVTYTTVGGSGGSSAAGGIIVYNVFYGPGQTISASLAGGVLVFMSGVVFSN